MKFLEFRNKKVLVTGHTGFKGSWLVSWLTHLGAKVVGVANNVPTSPAHFIEAQLSRRISDIRLDIRDSLSLQKVFLSEAPDFVFHFAAQSLVRQSYTNPIETWQTNVIGTINVLEALRMLENSCCAVLITSDKCYDNVEWVWGYRESDALGGVDPYSASKASAELAIKSYVGSFFPSDTSLVRIASARAGNVIGGGDWSPSRIVPDCVKAWSAGQQVELRSPQSTRPWQHVLEPLSGYLSLALALKNDPSLHGEPFNFGPQPAENYTVADLVETMSSMWPNVCWTYDYDTEQMSDAPESTLLRLNCDKALHRLNWKATMNFEDTVKMTTEWYRTFYESDASIEETTISQIINYASMAYHQAISWAI